MKDGEELYEYAVRIAAAAHSYQTDKGGHAYIAHPIRVSMKCKTIEAKIVAILHDVIEDTRVGADYLIANGFPKEIVDIVLILTRKKGEQYSEYIDRIKLNPIAREVKIYDLEDNMDIKRLEKLDETDIKRLNKYLTAYRVLTDGNE